MAIYCNTSIFVLSLLQNAGNVRISYFRISSSPTSTAKIYFLNQFIIYLQPFNETTSIPVAVRPKTHVCSLLIAGLVGCMQAYRGSKGIATLILNLGTRYGWVVNITPRQLSGGKEPRYPIDQEARWAPEPVLKFRKTRKSLVPGGLRTPDRTTRSLVTIPTIYIYIYIYIYILLRHGSCLSYLLKCELRYGIHK
jgi:hypothetical protein